MTTKKKVRKRQITLRSDPFIFTRTSLIDGSNLQTMRGITLVRGTQITESEGHPWAYNSKFKGKDIGGPFRTEKTFMEDDRDLNPPQPQWQLNGTFGNQRYRYFGPVYVVDPGHIDSYPPPWVSTDNDLLPWGTKAIAIVKPTNSVVDLSVAMGEMMVSGLPKIIGSSTWKDRSARVRNAGSEYLNFEFGWSPLLADVRGSAEAVSESEKIMRQYERDAGKVVRRSYEFPIVKETVTGQYSGPTFPQLGSKTNGDYGIMNTDTVFAFAANPNNFGRPIQVTIQTETKRWFSGAFSYYLPTSYDARDKWARAAVEADKLLGIEITPETLWNLTPWSWAADWFGNFGDVLANVSDFATDGLVLRYGYIMETKTIKYTFLMNDVHFKGYGSRNLTQVHTRVVKRRLPATPFGFGLTFDGFNQRQIEILAALGISKFR